MLGEDKGNYAIWRDRDLLSVAKKVRIVMGKSSAEMTVDRLNRRLTEEQIRTGWRYYWEMTSEKASVAKKAKSVKRRRAGRKRSRGDGR